jgi:hypothetical protein
MEPEKVDKKAAEEIIDYDLDEENLKQNIKDLYTKDDNDTSMKPNSNTTISTKKTKAHKTASKKSSNHKKKKSKLDRVSSLSSISSYDLDTSISSILSSSLSSNCSSCSCCTSNVCETSSSSLELKRTKFRSKSRSNLVIHKKRLLGHSRKMTANNEVADDDEPRLSKKRKSSRRQPPPREDEDSEDVLLVSGMVDAKRVRAEKMGDGGHEMTPSAALINEIKNNKIHAKQLKKKRNKTERVDTTFNENKNEEKIEGLVDSSTHVTESGQLGAKEKIIIIIDFDLVLNCAQCTRKQAQKELNELSEILPVLAYKLANFNYASYSNQFNNKVKLINSYRNSIQYLKSMNEADLRSKRVNTVCKSDQDQQEFDLAQNLKSKLDLIEKVLNECMYRIDLQQDYMSRIIHLFETFSRCRTSIELNACVSERRGYLVGMQEKLLEYAYSVLLKSKANKLDEVFFIKTLPFNALFDVLDRFVLVYNL